MGEGNAGLAEKFLKEFIGGLKAVGVTDVIAQKDVMLEEKNVVLPAVEENEPVFAELIVRSEVFSKQGAAGLGNDVVFHVDDYLCHLLSHTADDAAPGELQLR